MIHPARQMPWDELYYGLRHAVEAGLVNVQQDGDLRLYCYSKQCAFDRAWTPITEVARGLVLDVAARQVVATPFPKFFNVGERGANNNWPALPFETFEKVDGSLIAIWHHAGRWRCSTKGSFKSEQALKAQAIVDGWPARRLKTCFDTDETWIAEYVGPDNRIVVRYPDSGLVLLGGYDWRGCEYPSHAVQVCAQALHIRAAATHPFKSVADLLALAPTLPATQEGFVLRFSNGLRLKVKGDEYKRIHALVSDITPLGVWRAMEAGDDLTALKRDLPEEFWPDFDAIVVALEKQRQWIVGQAEYHAQRFRDLSDKDVGLLLPTIAADERPFVFPMRNGTIDAPKTRRALFRAIRPNGNKLDGYTPSYAMNRVIEEAA